MDSWRQSWATSACENFQAKSFIRSGQIMCAPRTLNQPQRRDLRTWRTRYGLQPTLGVQCSHCGRWCVERADHILRSAAGVWNTETALSIVFQRARNKVLSGFDGRPQDNAGNLSRPRAWINMMSSSALSPTLIWPCPKFVVMKRAAREASLSRDRRSIDVVGQHWPRLDENWQIGPLDNKNRFTSFFADSDGTKASSAKYSQQKFGDLFVQDRLAISNSLILQKMK